VKPIEEDLLDENPEPEEIRSGTNRGVSYGDYCIRAPDPRGHDGCSACRNRSCVSYVCI